MLKVSYFTTRKTRGFRTMVFAIPNRDSDAECRKCSDGNGQAQNATILYKRAPIDDFGV